MIVPLDGSMLAERALRYVEALPTGQLRLVAVEPIELSAARERWANDEPSRWGTWPIHDARAYLELIAIPFREQGWDVDIQVLDGKSGPTIVEAARDAELIVMSTRGHGLSRHLLGSTADYVVDHAPVPALLIRDEHPSAYAIFRIVVPLDGLPRSEEALPVAEQLRKKLGAGLQLIRVIDPSTSARTVEELTSEAAAYLEQKARELRDMPGIVSTEVRLGTPEEHLLDALQLGDLVVMATSGEGHFRRAVFGDVSTAFVDRSPVPVTFIRAAPGEMSGIFERARGRVAARSGGQAAG
jgi:nucleotide-binding universal stress UspA family protein